MPKRCTVCDHPERHSIDETLVSGAPYRSVAKRFGLSDSAVYRHKTEHLPAHLLKAKEAEEVAQANGLLEQVRDLQGHALGIPSWPANTSAETRRRRPREVRTLPIHPLRAADRRGGGRP